jgi:undecaprenyl-diphosphatase
LHERHTPRSFCNNARDFFLDAPHMPDLIHALLLGIIEGITEFLPISSTGHLLIAEHWLGARSDLFNIAIQAGAILAVVLIYRQRLWQLVTGLGQRENRDYALKLALAFGVTAVLGLLVKKLGFQLPETIEPIAWALLVGGFVMLGAEAIAARRSHVADDSPQAIGWGVAILVGIAQVVAGVFPGTSRSAAAIFSALLFGRGGRVAATEFAFLVGIPTMFAATGYELLHTLKDGGGAHEDWAALSGAFVVSALVAFAAVKWLLRYIQTHRFTVFAWYRILLGTALLLLLKSA